MSGGAEALYDAAWELLQAASLAVAGSPGGPIKNQAVWPGAPSYDCVPALYVHAGNAQVGDTYPLQPPLQPMQRVRSTGQVELVSFTITVLRCVPVLRGAGQTLALPVMAAINKSASETYGDLWAVWNGLIAQYRDGTLFASPSHRREFMLDPAIPVRTSGAAGGWEIGVRVQIPGYSSSWTPPA
jgi:hypothetical protein